MDIDPRLRDNSQRTSESYGQVPASATSYTLSPIHLPPPQQNGSGLQSRAQETGHPYYVVHDLLGSQPTHLPLPTIQHYDLVQSDQQVAHGGDRKDGTKRPRACEACRGLKVRCVPDPVKGTCKRCAKAGRQCVITAPSRKRQRKNDNRITELEQKIEALQASLQATRNRASDGETSEEEYMEESPESSHPSVRNSQVPGVQEATPWLQGSRSGLPGSPASPGLIRKRKQSVYHEEQDTVPASTQNGHAPQASAHGIPAFGTNAFTHSSQPGTRLYQAPSLDPAHHGNEYADVVDRKILDAETAAKIFRHYTNNMAPHMPVVVFPVTTAPGEIRQTKPILFLAILSVASGHDYPELQKILVREITRRYADCLIVTNDKSLELIQALQVSTIWHSPEDYKDAKTYQLIFLASVMAIALGLGQRRRLMSAMPIGWKETQQVRIAADASIAERRRAWVGLYVLSGITAVTLRQPSMLRWNSYIEECVDSFETSPDSLPSDILMGKWAKLQKIKEETIYRLEIEDAYNASGTQGLDSPRDLEAMREQLDEWESQNRDHSSKSLALGFQASKLLSLQIGVRTWYCDAFDGSKGPSDAQNAVKNFDSSKTSGVEIVRACVAECHKFLDKFLTFTVEDVRTIPTFHFIRTAYAVVVLLRLNNGAKAPGSELKKALPVEGTEVDSYITRLLDLMQKAAADEKSRPAQTFQLALRAIRALIERTGASIGYEQDQVHATHEDLKFEAQPVDTEVNTPRSGYRKIVVKNESTKLRPSRDSPKQALLPIILEQQPQPLQHPQQYAGAIHQMGSTPLHLLSQVATGDPPGCTPQVAGNSNVNSWYNNAYPPQALGPQSGSNHTSYPISDSSYYGVPLGYPDAIYANNANIMYQAVNTDQGFQQAMGTPYGHEIDLCNMFMDQSSLPLDGMSNFNNNWQG